MATAPINIVFGSGLQTGGEIASKLVLEYSTGGFVVNKNYDNISFREVYNTNSKVTFGGATFNTKNMKYYNKESIHKWDNKKRNGEIIIEHISGSRRLFICISVVHSNDMTSIIDPLFTTAINTANGGIVDLTNVSLNSVVPKSQFLYYTGTYWDQSSGTEGMSNRKKKKRKKQRQRAKKVATNVVNSEVFKSLSGKKTNNNNGSNEPEDTYGGAENTYIVFKEPLYLSPGVDQSLGIQGDKGSTIQVSIVTPPSLFFNSSGPLTTTNEIYIDCSPTGTGGSDKIMVDQARPSRRIPSWLKKYGFVVLAVIGSLVAAYLIYKGFILLDNALEVRKNAVVVGGKFISGVGGVIKTGAEGVGGVIKTGADAVGGVGGIIVAGAGKVGGSLKDGAGDVGGRFISGVGGAISTGAGAISSGAGYVGTGIKEGVSSYWKGEVYGSNPEAYNKEQARLDDLKSRQDKIREAIETLKDSLYVAISERDKMPEGDERNEADKSVNELQDKHTPTIESYNAEIAEINKEMAAILKERDTRQEDDRAKVTARKQEQRQMKQNEKDTRKAAKKSLKIQKSKTAVDDEVKRSETIKRERVIMNKLAGLDPGSEERDKLLDEWSELGEKMKGISGMRLSNRAKRRLGEVAGVVAKAARGARGAGGEAGGGEAAGGGAGGSAAEGGEAAGGEAAAGGGTEEGGEAGAAAAGGEAAGGEAAAGGGTEEGGEAGAAAAGGEAGAAAAVFKAAPTAGSTASPRAGGGGEATRATRATRAARAARDLGNTFGNFTRSNRAINVRQDGSGSAKKSRKSDPTSGPKSEIFDGVELLDFDPVKTNPPTQVTANPPTQVRANPLLGEAGEAAAREAEAAAAASIAGEAEASEQALIDTVLGQVDRGITLIVDEIPKDGDTTKYSQVIQELKGGSRRDALITAIKEYKQQHLASERKRELLDTVWGHFYKWTKAIRGLNTGSADGPTADDSRISEIMRGIKKSMIQSLNEAATEEPEETGSRARGIPLSDQRKAAVKAAAAGAKALGAGAKALGAGAKALGAGAKAAAAGAKAAGLGSRKRRTKEVLIDTGHNAVTQGKLEGSANTVTPLVNVASLDSVSDIKKILDKLTAKGFDIQSVIDRDILPDKLAIEMGLTKIELRKLRLFIEQDMYPELIHYQKDTTV